MRLRELNRTPEPPQQDVVLAAPGHLDSMRAQGEDFLQAGDAAIERALSGDSLVYNQASQQSGGQ
jgi:hypothetical protein